MDTQLVGPHLPYSTTIALAVLRIRAQYLLYRDAGFAGSEITSRGEMSD